MPSGPSALARALARVLVIWTLLGAGLLFSAGSAQAGGPTSALLVSPTTDRTASVYYSDAEYDRLSTALGGYSPSADPTVTQHSAPGSAYITVTWMIHDVSVWRIDRIFLTGDAAGPLIVTQLQDGDQAPSAGMYPGEAGNDRAVWHRAPDPAALQNVLSTLGLVGTAAARAAEGAVSSTVDTAAAEGAVSSTVDPAAVGPGDVAASVGAAVDPAARAGTAWWWAIAGMAAGTLFTVVAVRFIPAVRRRLLAAPAAGEPVPMMQISV